MRNCTGNSTSQDVQCNSCPPCRPGFYINRSCPGGNIITRDTSQCAACKAQCSAGFFPSGLCDGTSKYDMVECKPCTSKCPPGMYMHAPCNGSSSPLPDCRPCLSAQHQEGYYISGGSCANGSGTNASDIQYTACKTCTQGKQKLLQPCLSMSLKDTVKCEDCAPCEQGFYINRTCDGKTNANRTCAPCRMCPPGFYRRGCLYGNSTRDDVQCIPCTNCSLGFYVDSACSGKGFSPLERTCTACSQTQQCLSGQYISAPCTGSSLQRSDAQCKACTSFCPVGSFIQEGCSGDTMENHPTSCIPCTNECQDNFYLVSPCTGRSRLVQVFSPLVFCFCLLSPWLKKANG